MPGTIAINAA